ncbi:MAG: cytochrome c biogenesis protein ResB, partial [Candidatus Omnitrophica bacterium]|nr:cytochrome c biogenesis protein ResB [Candidatus Omnitrophota bacterium]
PFVKNPFLNRLQKSALVQRLSSLRITLTCLFLLFVLTLWGTVAQVYQGLYLAQHKFFYSLFFLAGGFFPFPGAQLVLWVLFVNLFCATMVRFKARWESLGIWIIHAGLLTYFFAAFVTFHLAEESNLTLMEGQSSNVSSAYHQWELSIWKDSPITRQVIAFDDTFLKSQKILTVDEWDLKIVPQVFYSNSQAFRETEATKIPSINDSGIGVLKPSVWNKEPEKNIPGGIFKVLDKSENQEIGDVLLYGGEGKPTQILVGDQKYFFQLRRKKYVLPFVLQLKDFRKELHPNTEIARSYQSLVEIQDRQMNREVLISMNEPLRYKDFTFYQASYSIDAMGRESSTLAVVKNAGRILPYISAFITFLGLVVHFFVLGMLRKK